MTAIGVSVTYLLLRQEAQRLLEEADLGAGVRCAVGEGRHGCPVLCQPVLQLLPLRSDRQTDSVGR